MKTPTTNYFYKVYGISLVSSFPLPSLVEVDEAVASLDDSLFVTKGRVDMTFDNQPTAELKFARFNENEFYFDMPGVGLYSVRNGKNIVIEQISEDWDLVLMSFYASCITAALYQRDLIPLHVSGVLDSENRAWLFAGLPGAGKSTTALFLSQQGYRLFTDDSALLSISNDTVKAVSSYPMLRVWQTTLDAIKLKQTDIAFQVRQDQNKYGIHFHETFVDEAVDVAGIIFVENNDNGGISINQIDPVNGFERLRSNLYRRQWIRGMKKEQQVFKLMSGILTRVPLWSARRPKNQMTFTTFTDAIIDEIIHSRESN